MRTLTNSRCKELAKLKQKKYRDETNTFLVETKHLVEEALLNAEVLEIFEQDNQTKHTYITEDQMRKLSETESSSKVLALVKKNTSGINRIKGDIILLDDIQDPGNLGTIMRTCVSFGYKNILINENNCDPYNSKVIRSSQGAIFKVNLFQSDLMNFIKDFQRSHKREEYQIFGTALKNAEKLQNVSLGEGMQHLIIFGNEGNGIKEELLNLTDKNIFIEIDQMESLNVAVSCGILLYQMSIQKKGRGI